MQHKFGFWTLTFLVIANMIGAGVYTTSGYSIQALGSAPLVVLAWGVGGLIAVAGAYSYGLLVKVMPESGGEYLFLSRAAHPLLGFIAGWVSLIAGFSGAIAYAATALESYTVPETIRPDWLPVGSVAVLSIILAGTFHGLKPNVGAMAQNAVVLLKLILLAAILLFAATSFAKGQWQGVGVPASPPTGWNFFSTFAGSLVWISLSYAGFNAAVYIAGEVDAAERTVPKALVAGTVLVVLLYVLLNSVFVFAASPESINGQGDVAAIAARAIGGSGFETFVRGAIAISLLTSVFSMMMAAPRVYAKMADDGLMPGRLRFQGNSPISATLLQIVVAVLLVLVSSLQGLLSYLGLTLSISAACSVACLLLPSVRQRPLLHPVHLLPLFYIVSTLLAAAMWVSFEPRQLLGTALTFAAGIIAYFLTKFLNPSAELNKAPQESEVVVESQQ